MARAAEAAEAAEAAAGVKSHFAKLTNNSSAFLLVGLGANCGLATAARSLSALNFDSVMGRSYKNLWVAKLHESTGHMRQISKLSSTPVQLRKVSRESKRSHLIRQV